MECPACSSLNEATDRFCGQCGEPLGEAQSAPARVAEGIPNDERRLVSVLFVDLVGFTSLAESRDAEDVRALLSRYFDTCSTHIARHGGMVEKFIGDAVMAVWGTPIAHDDDAERAVRAALEVVGAVAAMADEIDEPTLQARAGVLTGEAAVSLGAEAEAMVLGDMVNTASRIQSAAEPGQVFVGSSTKWATESQIAFEDAGVHELKGKAEPMQLFRALRVIGGQSDWDETPGGDVPFVGRERELRLVKETFHASTDEGRAHLMSVIGPAGVGKTRLAREFGRYLDALVDDVYWHRGRCPAYGDGLAYWALVEMVKMRCGIAEEEDGASAMEKLVALLDETVADPDERRWMTPRLATLLGLEGTAAADRDELFAAWSLLFERLAEDEPTVLIFEDLHFADSSLLDFIDYLVERGRSSRLFILTLARPELIERREAWGSGHRTFTSLHLDPLPTDQMREILDGLVPGLSSEIEDEILGRAQGIPLYAVEIVRMLLDRGILVRDDGGHPTVAELADLALPETLQALVASRLDALDPQERRVVQDGAVLGKSFFKEGVTAVSGLPAEQVDGLLSSLVRKQILTLQTDPRSPERGQYSFLQDLVRQVAYGTIAKRQRKAKHVAAAAFIGSTALLEAEVVEVVANHYLQAFEIAPDDDDAPAIRERALEMLRRAADRASTLGASMEAQGYLERAARLTDDPAARAAVIERAGEMALMGERFEEADSLIREALALYEDQLDARGAARASARLADVDWSQGNLDEAVERMEKAFATLSVDQPDTDLATLAAQLGRLHYFRGDKETAMLRVETALDIAESLDDAETTAQALITMGAIVGGRHPQHEWALVSHALTFSLEHELAGAALRAYNNLAEIQYRFDRFDLATTTYREGIAYANRIGNRFWSDLLLSEITYPLFVTGSWDEALASVAAVSAPDHALPEVLGRIVSLTSIYSARGEGDPLRRELAIHERYASTSSVQERISWAIGQAIEAMDSDDHAAAFVAATEALDSAGYWDADSSVVKMALWVALDAAWAMGDLARVEETVRSAEQLRSVIRSPVIAGHLAIGRARIGISTGAVPESIGASFSTAADLFLGCDARFWEATTATEHAEWLVEHGQPEEAAALRARARDVFDAAGALTWLRRLDRADDT